jgi:hypothetical protein
MANPNPQLEAALAQLAAKSGTTPDQVAQLRAAITADPDLLRQLNQQAVAGQVKSFALAAPGGAPNLTGIYDKQAGLLTLPATSFRPSGTAASDDLKAVVGLQAMSVDFAHKTWQDAANQTQTVSQDMVSNLQSTLNGSPVLASQIKEAMKQGHVRHFGLLDGTMAAGATYDGEDANARDRTPKGINLPPLGLQTGSAANSHGRFDARDMTFVLGHEIQHGFNDASKDQARSDFLKAIGQQARVQSPLHDYTDELRGYIQAGREDEAKAEIAGWNALLSREQQSNPAAGVPEMARIRNGRLDDFIVRGSSTAPAHAHPGLTFNSDGSLSQTPANIAAMGQHYFDRPSPNHAQPGQRPVHIGQHKDLAGNPQPTADYTNYYGTWALEQIAAAEDRANVRHQGARPQIAIHMAGLGLKEDLIEMEGLDLGRNKSPRSYMDTSQTPAAQGRFHHTQDGSVNAQHDHQYVPIAPRTPSPPGRRQPDTPDHDLLEKLRDGVRRLDQDAGKGWDDASERLAASALLMAKEKGFTAQDELQLSFNKPTQRYAAGELLHLSRQGPGESPDPAANRSHMTTAEALSKPVSERYQEAEAINITQERTQALQLMQQQSISPDDPARGPVMRM